MSLTDQPHPGTDPAPSSRRRPRRRRSAQPLAMASALAPGGRRRHWAALVRCPQCGYPHLCRSRELAGIPGIRRLPCGHQITLVIGRVYQRRVA